MLKWLPFIGWQDLSAESALELGLEQPYRWAWRAFVFEWLGFGFTVAVEVKGLRS